MAATVEDFHRTITYFYAQLQKARRATDATGESVRFYEDLMNTALDDLSKIDHKEETVTQPIPPAKTDKLAVTHALVQNLLNAVAEADRPDVLTLLDQLTLPDTYALAAALALRLHAQRPRAIKRELAVVETLSLAVTLINGGAVASSVDPTNDERLGRVIDELDRRRIRGVFTTRQQAMFAAVRQLGGANPFGIDADTEAQLGADKKASGQLLDRVEHVASDKHGWRIRDTDFLGFILFQTGDR